MTLQEFYECTLKQDLELSIKLSKDINGNGWNLNL